MLYIIYKTTNIINKKEYIGIHQTDNIDDGYLGSGLAIKRSIKKYGVENFKREILEFCNSFEELLIKEKKYVNEDWVNNKNNYNLKTGGQSAGILSKDSKNKISETLKKKYLNGELKYHGKPYKPTEYQKNQMSEILKNKYANGEIIKKIGIEPWNKGKKTGQNVWNKGKKLGPMDEELKNKISERMTDKIKNNPELKKIQSEKLKKYYKETPHPTKGLEPWNKGIEMTKTECPHCGKLVDIGNGKRWHFDNCKNK